MKPAVTNNQPIGFSGRRDARTIPSAAPAMFTTLLRMFEKVHCPEEPAAGNTAWRSTNIRTSWAIIIAIEKVPTDQASLEAILGFIFAAHSLRPAAETKVCQHDPLAGQTSRQLECHHQPLGTWACKQLADVSPAATPLPTDIVR